MTIPLDAQHDVYTSSERESESAGPSGLACQHLGSGPVGTEAEDIPSGVPGSRSDPFADFVEALAEEQK